jgi:hypothetical protein
MLAIKGIYDGNQIKFLEKTPKEKKFKVIVTFVEEINEETEMRDFSAQTTAMEFWQDEREDLYQDYLIKK